jgi:hypothetical protein
MHSRTWKVDFDLDVAGQEEGEGLFLFEDEEGLSEGEEGLSEEEEEGLSEEEEEEEAAGARAAGCDTGGAPASSYSSYWREATALAAEFEAVQVSLQRLYHRPPL